MNISDVDRPILMAIFPPNHFIWPDLSQKRKLPTQILSNGCSKQIIWDIPTLFQIRQLKNKYAFILLFLKIIAFLLLNLAFSLVLLKFDYFSQAIRMRQRRRRSKRNESQYLDKRIRSKSIPELNHYNHKPN